MGVDVFKIELDNAMGVYVSGQAVSGAVLLQLDSEVKVKEIQVKVKGEAMVRFSRSERHRVHNRSQNNRVTYSASEEYFKYKVVVYQQKGDESLGGEHRFPFAVQLPPQLPSSFEGDHGHVRYTVSASLSRSLRLNRNAKVMLTVLSHVDLNGVPNMRVPVGGEKSHTFGCLCWRSGPLTLRVSLPCSGYVPGQQVPVKVELDNMSNVEVTTVNCRLKQVVTYHATRPAFHQMQSFREVPLSSLPGVGPQSSNVLTNVLNIPPLPPSILLNCTIITLQYLLEVDAKVVGLHINQKVVLPVFIGTIPFWNTTPVPVPGPQYGGLSPSAPNVVPSAPSMEPPSYEECMFGAATIHDEEDSSEMQFTPRYPTYKPPIDG